MKRLRISDPRQRKALTSPVRIELIETLIRLGAASVAELAERMGRAPDSLYYHVRLLERVGVLRVVERRRSGANREAVYACVAERVELDCDPESEASVHAEEQSLGALLRLTERTYSRALRGGRVRAKGAARDLQAHRVRATLDAAGRRELNRRLDELLDFLRAANRRADEGGGKGRATSVVFVVSPIEE